MTEGTRYALLGVFVLLGLAAVGGLMVMIGETPSWLGGAEWEMRIVNVRLLSPVAQGTEVNLSGVTIGRVERLEHVDKNNPGKGAVIITKIKKRYGVPIASVAKIYAPTLGIGRGHIDIIPPDVVNPPKLSEDSAVIEGEVASMLREIISDEMIASFHRTTDNIADFAEALTPVARDLHGMMEQRTIEEVDLRGATANLTTVIERFDDAIKNLNNIVGGGQMQQDVQAFAANLRQAGEGLVELVKRLDADSARLAGSIETKLDLMDQRMETVLAAVMPLLEDLGQVSASLSRAARSLDEGNGSLALMLRDDRLYESLVESAERIALLVATLQPLAEKIAAKERIPVEAKTRFGTFNKDIKITP